MAKEQLIKDWLAGKITNKELEEAKQNDPELEGFEQIINATSQIKVPEGKSKEEAWNHFMDKVSEEKPAKVRKFNPVIPIAIAATLALAIVSYIFIFSSTTIVATPGDRLSYSLPDGSEVTLNADSKISFQSFNWNKNRAVNLEGEAFFKVKKGSTFTVAGPTTTITVLGTAFNAYFRNDEAQVACFEGRVNVETPGKKTITLTKGEATVNLKDIVPVNESKDASWRQGEFYFENESLPRVIQALERQYAVDIEYHGLSDRVYTGYFNDRNLEEALQLVLKPMGLTYKKNGQKIIVK